MAACGGRSRGDKILKSYFFNAEPTTDLVAHPTGYDREYDADDLAAFWEQFFTRSGVFAGTNADACKPVVVEDTTVRILPGAVFARGRMAIFDGTETLEVTDGSTIVARMVKGADVRDFRLLAVEEVVDTEDVCDVPLASVSMTPVMGGHDVTLTDRRPFMAFTGQPPYYPPDSDHLPYILWLYVLGLPMTAEQRAAVEGDPSLMAIHNASIGAGRSVTVTFADTDWRASGDEHTITIPRSRHKRQSGDFHACVWHLVNGSYVKNTWAAFETDVRYNSATGDIVLTYRDTFPGKVTFSE